MSMPQTGDLMMEQQFEAPPIVTMGTMQRKMHDNIVIRSIDFILLGFSIVLGV